MLRIIYILAILCVSAFGQDSISFYGTGGFASSHWFASSTHGEMAEIALSYGKTLYSGEYVTARWVFEGQGIQNIYDWQGGRKKINGAGFSPAGMDVEFTDKTVRPFAQASGGILYAYDHLFGETFLNFTAQFGGGLRVRVLPKWDFSAGYRHYHVSNANLGRKNPGMDNHAAILGISYLR